MSGKLNYSISLDYILKVWTKKLTYYKWTLSLSLHHHDDDNYYFHYHYHYHYHDHFSMRVLWNEGDRWYIDLLIHGELTETNKALDTFLLRIG